MVVELGKDSSGRTLRLDASTIEKKNYADNKLGFKLTVTQGSYMSEEAAEASGTTHNDGGVLDLRVWDLPKRITIDMVLKEYREAGIILWLRTKAQGFDEIHFHGLDRGNPRMSPSAKRQEQSFLNGGNGLASNGPDDGPKVIVPINVPQLVKPYNPVTGPKLRQHVSNIHDAWTLAGSTHKGYKKLTEGRWNIVNDLRGQLTNVQTRQLIDDLSLELAWTMQYEPGKTKKIKGLNNLLFQTRAIYNDRIKRGLAPVR